MKFNVPQNANANLVPIQRSALQATTINTPCQPEGRSKKSLISKVGRMPIRLIRAGLGINTPKEKASFKLSETQPNTIDSNRFDNSQHPNSGPVRTAEPKPTGLAPLTPQKANNFPEYALVNNKNEVESTQMQVFAQGLIKELDCAEDLILASADERHPLSSKTRSKIIQSINVMRDRLADCAYLESSGSENMHQYLRDKFDEISDIAKAVRKQLPKPNHELPDGNNINIVDNSDTQKLALFFEDFSDFSTEVKRHHYDRGIQLQINSYADKIYNHILTFAPSLVLQRKGSELIVTKEALIKASTGAQIGGDLLFAGIAAEFAYSWTKRAFVDQDSDACSHELKTKSIAVDAGIRRGSLAANEEGRDRLTLKAIVKGKISESKGNYYDYKNFHEHIKAEIQRDGDKWCLFNRHHSGNEKSKRNVIRQKRNAAVSYVFGDLLGVKNLKSTVAPVFNTNKCMKGRANEERMSILAGKLINRLPGVPATTQRQGLQNADLKALVELAYPPISSQIEKFNPAFGETGVLVEPKIFSGASDLVSMRSPCTVRENAKGDAVVRREGSVGGEISMATFEITDPNTGACRFHAKAGVDYTYASQKIDMLRLKPMHEQLNPAYNRDANISKELLNKLLEPEGVDEENRVPQAKFLNRLSRDLRVSSFKCSGQNDRVRDNNNRLINDMAIVQHGKLRDLRMDYAELSRLSGQAVTYRGNSGTDDINKRVFEEKRAAFILKIFGLTDGNFTDDGQSNLNSKKQKEFHKNLISNPEFFMSKSYDALSTALGCIGVSIFDSKKNIAQESEKCQQANLPLSITKQNNDNIQLIDVMYQSLSNVMDGVFMPIDKEKLLRGASARATCKSTSTTQTGSAVGEVGIDMSPFRLPSGQMSQPFKLRAVKGDENYQESPPIEVWNESSTSGIDAKYSYSQIDANSHPNPIREGTYSIHRVIAGADGITPAVIKGAMIGFTKIANKFSSFRNMEWFNHKLGLEQTNEANLESLHRNHETSQKNKEDGYVEQAVMLTKRVALGEVNGDIEFLTQKKRSPDLKQRPPSEKVLQYRETAQCYRTIARSTQNVGATIGVPLHGFGIPATVGGGFHRTCSEGNVLSEVLGRNPAYQILSFIELQEVMNKASKNKKTTEPGSGTVDCDNVANECNFEMMKDLFNNKPVPGQKPIDADFKVNKFFGTEESILGYLTDFVEYQDGRREFPGPNEEIDPNNIAERKVNGKDVARSEFDALDDNPEYWETMVKTSENCGHCPGSRAYEKRGEQPIVNNSRVDPRPTLSVDERRAITEAIAHFKSPLHKNETPKQRMEYFMSQANGRKVFASYCKVVGSYDKINEALKSRNQYKIELADTADWGGH